MKKVEDKSSQFFALYNRINANLHAYLYAILHNRDDAEDVLQETASCMWQKFDQFELGTNFEAWSFSIARIKALEFLRKNRKNKLIFDEQFYDMISKKAVYTSKDIPDRVEAMKTCVKKLSEKDSTLLSMRFLENLPLKQISLKIGRKPSSVCQSFTRVLEMLRLCIMRTLLRQES